MLHLLEDMSLKNINGGGDIPTVPVPSISGTPAVGSPGSNITAAWYGEGSSSPLAEKNLFSTEFVYLSPPGVN